MRTLYEKLGPLYKQGWMLANLRVSFQRGSKRSLILYIADGALGLTPQTQVKMGGFKVQGNR